MAKNKNLLIVAGILALLIVFTMVLTKAPSKPGQYDEFAKCLGDQGALFYGAFWCPHCRDQKALFGKSAEKLPYVECSTADGRNQLQVCKEVGIESYPTWVFSDGERLVKVMSLEELSDKTGCPVSESENLQV